MSESGSFSRDVLQQLAGCKLPEWSLLAGAISTKYLTSGAPLFHAGENRPFVYVVNAGVIKMVYETKEGEGWVKGFAQAGLARSLRQRDIASYVRVTPVGLSRIRSRLVKKSQL